MLANGGVIDWALKPLGLHGPGLRAARHHADAGLPVAAVHDPAGLRRLRAAVRLAARGVVRPRCHRRPYLPVGRPAGGLPGAGGRLDLHVLADPRRLHHGQDRRRQDPDVRQRHLRQHRRGQQPAVRRCGGGRAGRSDRGLPHAGPPYRAPWTTCDPLPAGPHPAPASRWRWALAVIYVPLLVVLANSFNAVQDLWLAAAAAHRLAGGTAPSTTPVYARRCGPASRWASAPRRSPWCSARWRPSPSPATGSSAGKR